jgi:outer membrane protein assembly factor BamB
MKPCALLSLMVLCAAAPAPPATQPTLIAAFHGGGGLLGQAEPIGGPPMNVRWTFSVRDSEPPTSAPTTEPEHAASIEIQAQPIIAGQMVYVADGAGGLHALDLSSGKQRWEYHSADGFETSPLVMDGEVFLGDLGGIFHAVAAADGKKLWTFDAGNTIHSSANSINGEIVFGTDGADIYCLSTAGKQVWHAKAGDRINGAPAVAGNEVFVSGCDAQLRALNNADGSERFVSDLGALAPGSPAVLADRMVIGTDEGRVVCMPIGGGKPIWEFEGIDEHAMVYASPAVADGVAVIGARDRKVYGLDVTSGKVLWSFATRGDVDASPVISGERVYAASRDKHLYVLDLQSGKLLWDFNAGRPIAAGVAIGEGVLVLADTGGTVRCLEPAKP